MRIACLLMLAWPAMAVESLQEARQRGAEAETNGQWEQAAAIYETTLRRLATTGPSQDRFWLLTSLTEISFERQDYWQAHRWLEKAEEAIGDLPENAPERVRLLSASGTLHLTEGNLTAAQRELSRAVALSESVASPIDLAAALHNLAAVEMHTRHLAEATAHETKALAIWREELGGQHRYVTKALISLSSLQGLRGDWRGAAASLEMALGIAGTPEALANYAVVLDRLKRHKEAREIRRRSRPPSISPRALADVKEMTYERERNVRTR